jgi:hypothetical protein
MQVRLNEVRETWRNRAADRRVVRSAFKRAAALLTLLLPLGLTSCGGGVGEALVVPFFTFQFEGVLTGASGERQVVQLNLNPAQQGQASGSFASVGLSTRNRVPIATPEQTLTAAGSFSGRSLNLDVPGAVLPLAKAYSGQFVEDDTIVLTPATGSAPAITVVRADNSFRPKLHDSNWTGKDGAGRDWKLSFKTRPDFDEGATELLSGSEQLAGQTSTLEGFATMRRLEITIQRGAPAVETRLSGRMGPALQKPPLDDSSQAPAQTITFPDGGTLTRVAPPPP